MALPTLFFVDRSDRGRLRLTGRDRQSFLQGMVSNDVGRLAPGQGCYAFQLDATGHVLADMRVLCTEDALLLDVEPGLAPQVAETLEKYLIMERCRIADVTAETGQLLIGGAGAAEFLMSVGIADAAGWPEGQNARSDAASGEATALVAATRLLPVPAFDAYGEPGALAALRAGLAAAGAEEVPAEALEPYRIEAGVPRFGIDIDSRVLAPETGQQARAISYKKGCYIGQEIVARIDARGHTNRALAGFYLSEPVAPDTPVVGEDGREVGRVTSSALSPSLALPIGLGYVRNTHAAPNTAVTVGGKPAQVAALPFIAEGRAATP
jgi:folate-binding protein YgfZ